MVTLFLYRGGETEWLSKLTDRQLGFGSLAVNAFFFYSGLLVCKSMIRIGNVKTFLFRRIIRVIPALAFVVCILTFVIGPIVTDISFYAYFTNPKTYLYILNSFLILVHNLPGVFVNSPYNSTVNGVLWTLPVEFVCYLACAFMYKMKVLNYRAFKIMLPCFILLYFILIYILPSSVFLFAILKPCMMFYIGMVCYIYSDHIVFNRIGILSAIVGVYVSCVLKLMEIGVVFFIPYILLWLAFSMKLHCCDVQDISYGVYLCGWPIQQCLNTRGVSWISRSVSWMLAAFMAIICGIFIWHFIDGPINKTILNRCLIKGK